MSGETSLLIVSGAIKSHSVPVHIQTRTHPPHSHARTMQERALTAFRLKSEKWGVNVQSLSGSPANFQV